AAVVVVGVSVIALLVLLELAVAAGRLRSARSRRNDVALGVTRVARGAVGGPVITLLARVDDPVPAAAAAIRRIVRGRGECPVRRCRRAAGFEGADVTARPLGSRHVPLVGLLTRRIAAARTGGIGRVERRAASEKRMGERRAPVVLERTQVRRL